MYGEDTMDPLRQPAELSAADGQLDSPPEEWDEWDDLQPAALAANVCDAFDLDGETLEPEPEPGDFWGELDDEELS